MNKTYITITIDTEYSTHMNDMGIIGKIGNASYGIPLFIELLKKHNCHATYYMDVYTDRNEFHNQFSDMGRQLIEDGHDLQLHTHPNGQYDQNRIAMKDYSLKEQIDILGKGRELFKQYFNQMPSAHRAGDWGANLDTLNALKEVQIFCDSSLFIGWPNCHLNNSLDENIDYFYHDSVLELPATVFSCSGLGLFSPYRLLSTDGNSLNETFALCKKYNRSGVKIITLVYHSFSFIRWNKSRTEYSPVHHRMQKFDQLLELINKSNEFEIITVKDAIYKCSKTNFDDTIKNQVLHQGPLKTFDRVIDRIKGKL